MDGGKAEVGTASSRHTVPLFSMAAPEAATQSPRVRAANDSFCDQLHAIQLADARRPGGRVKPDHGEMWDRDRKHPPNALKTPDSARYTGCSREAGVAEW